MEEYKACPRCDRPTRLSFAPHEPIDLYDAKRRKLQCEFERYCEERDAERERAGLPSPEVLGRLDARRALAEIREFDERVEAA